MSWPIIYFVPLLHGLLILFVPFWLIGIVLGLIALIYPVFKDMEYSIGNFTVILLGIFMLVFTMVYSSDLWKIIGD